MTRQAPDPSLAILVAISAVNPLALNIVAPSFPAIAREFSVDYGVAQLTLTVFLASIAIAQLILGPLSDRVGRRPPVLAGLGIFMVGSLICATAPSIAVLLAGRVVESLGACAGFVLARAMVRDRYGQEGAASRIGYITMVMVVAPMLSPLLGGLIEGYSGWRMVHVAMAALGAATAVYAFFALPETLDRSKPRQATQLLASFATLIRLPAFRRYMLTMAFTSAAYFAFIAGAPFAVVELMGLSSAVYGLWFAVVAAGYMIGNFVSGRYAQRFGTTTLIRIGTIGAVGVAVLMIPALWLFPLSPPLLFIPMVLIAAFNGLTLPGATAGALSVRPDMAGAAAGLSGSVQIGTGALATWLVGMAMHASVWPIPLAILLCSAVSAIAFLGPNRHIRQA